MKKSILAIFVALLMASALLLTSCSDSAVALATFADLMDTSYVGDYDKMASELVKLDGLEDYDYAGSNENGTLLLFTGEKVKTTKIVEMKAVYNIETDAVVWEESYTLGKGVSYSVDFPGVWSDTDVFRVVKTEVEENDEDDDEEGSSETDDELNEEPMTEAATTVPSDWGDWSDEPSADENVTTYLYGADGTLIVEKEGDVSLEGKGSGLYAFDDALLYDDNGTMKVIVESVPAYNTADVDAYDGTYLYSWGRKGFVAYDSDMKVVSEWQIDQSIGSFGFEGGLTEMGLYFVPFGGKIFAQVAVPVADTEGDYDFAFGSEKYALHTYLINPADLEAKDAVQEIDVNYVAVSSMMTTTGQYYPDGYVTDGKFAALAYVCMIEDKVLQTSDMRVVALDDEAQIVFFAEIAANQENLIENVGNGYYVMSTAAGTVILDEKGEQVATYNGDCNEQTQSFLRFGDVIYDWTLNEIVDLDEIDNAELVGVWDTYFVYTVTEDDETTYWIGTADGTAPSEMFTNKVDSKKSYTFYDSFYTMTKIDEDNYSDSTVTIYTVMGEKIQTFDRDEYQGSQSIGNGKYLITIEEEDYILK